MVTTLVLGENHCFSFSTFLGGELIGYASDGVDGGDGRSFSGGPSFAGASLTKLTACTPGRTDGNDCHVRHDRHMVVLLLCRRPIVPLAH
jgi:hypothetical protein